MTSSIPMLMVQQKLAGRSWRPAGYFYAVDGTAYPGAPAVPLPIINDGTGTWSGFSSGMVGGMINVRDGLWASRCIGYEATTIPMWPSVQQGRANLIAAIKADAAAYLAANGTYAGLVITGSGYSQGSMVWDQVWVEDILSPTGVLHYLLPYVYRIYQFGHVFRTPGIAHGNALIGSPESITQNGVESGGIGGTLDLTVAQTNYLSPVGTPVIYSCANHGDIYTCSPMGTQPWSISTMASQGKTGYIFFRIIMDPTFLDVVEAVEVLEHPIDSIEEGFNAAQFFSEGVNAPHYQYYPQMLGCITDVMNLGESLPHQL